MDTNESSSNKKSFLYVGIGIGIILIIFLFIRACGGNHQTDTGKPTSSIPHTPIDPTDSLNGICERFITSNGHLVDSLQPQSNKSSPIRITYSGASYLRYAQGGSQKIRLRYTTNGAEAKSVLIGLKGINKYYSIPATPDTSSNKPHSVYCELAIDSSIQPGLFEINIALQDSTSNVSKSVSKFVVVGSTVKDASQLLPSWWQMIRSTNVANTHGHYIQFDAVDRCGEWVNEKEQRTLRDKLTMAFSMIRTKPNLDAPYVLKADTVLEFGGRQNTYHVIALTQRTLILREVQGGEGRFGAFRRVKPEDDRNEFAQKPSEHQ